MKTVLVTGGAGYIGSVLVRLLLDKGYSVRVFDRLVYGREPVEELLDNEAFELVEGDIRRLDEFPALLEGVGCVVHLASLSNDPSCDLKPAATVKINYEGAMDLAARCKKAGIKRFVFASSCSTYGRGHGGALTEESHLHPVSLYAETMVRCEERLREMAGPGFCPTMLRQATVFGLSPRMRFDLAINVMTLHAVRTGKVFVLGGGQQWRPFVHVSDAARAFMAVLEAPEEKVCGEVFNVGSNDQNYQIINLAGIVKQVLPETEVEVAPGDADTRNYNVCFDKITDVLGYRAEHTAADGVREIAGAIKGGVLKDLDSLRYYNLKLLKKLELTPAVEGGEQALSDFLPFSLPLIGKEEEDEVLDTLRSGWITTGPKTKRFEEMFREYVGSEHAVALSSCTAALHLSLVASGIGPGDEVITTPLTFPATVNVILHQGARPVLVDIDPDTLNIDASKIMQAVTDKTRAVIPVHMAGRPCEMDAIKDIAAESGLKVIEDAAHAAGSVYRGKRVGSLSDAACFSFYPIKNMTAIEGGMLTTDDGELAGKVRLLSLHGMTKDAWKRYSSASAQHWEIVYPGYKCNMTDVQAAVGIHQLGRLDSFIETRRRYADIYDDAFSGLEGLELFGRPKDCVSSYHLYIIKLRTERLKIDRDGFMEALRRENIGTGLHFRSVHLHKYYRETFKFRPEDFPAARDVSERILSLPLYPKMSEEDVYGVIEGVKKVIQFYTIN